ncbi:MAG TPA: diguanylate cyclase, partial [Mycobacteriales bacterium]|nr:diguanylate cyclase [Mycobacteriales bacterium]
MSGPGRVDETEVDELSSGYQPTETVAFPAPRPHRQVHDVARRDVSQLLVDVARRVGGTLDLHRTLEHITQAVVDLLGYQVAVMNLVTAHGELEVVTVAGPAAVRQQLLGSRESLPRWQALLDGAQQLGSLRFVDHRAGRPPGTRDRFPELTVVDHRPAWHPEDALFAPLHAGDGSLLGVLSVDLPADGLRPNAHQRELLELLAVQASLALDHARLFAKLQRSEGSFQRTFEHSPVGMAIFGPDRRYLRANRAYCDFLQRAEADLLGHQPEEFTHADDQTLSTDVGDTVRLTGDDVSRVDKRYLLPDGRVVWGRLSLTPLAGPRGHLEVIAYLEDITESRAVVRELERRATTDTLTGLANRATFDHTLETLLLDPSAQVTVLFCDVDHFKSVNDTFGHAAGDELLRQIGRNVTGVLRAQDLAARLGGDEFVVLLTGGVTQAQAHSVAERIRQSTRRIASVQGHTIVTSISIGVAVRTPGVGSRELLGSADRALYESKRRGRDCIAT